MIATFLDMNLTRDVFLCGNRTYFKSALSVDPFMAHTLAKSDWSVDPFMTHTLAKLVANICQLPL